MLALFLGICAGVLLGVSDLFAAKTSKFVPSITVARSAFTASTIVAVVLVIVVHSTFTVRDSLISLCSGALMAIGLALLYEGYKVSSIGLIAPTCAVLLGLVPVVDSIRKGDRPSSWGWMGMALGIIAIGMATYQPGEPGKARMALLFGAGSGLMFGCAFALFDYTSKASGLTPVLIQRLSAGLILGAAMLFDKTPGGRAPWIAIHPPARTLGILTGVAAGLAIACVQLGYRAGSSGPVAVATSQFATVGVVLSVIFEKEKLRRLQWIGLGCAAIGVGLLAAS